LFGEDVYVHQFKLNAKAAFEGDLWQWHQDYGSWARDDGMPEARAMNIAVFLEVQRGFYLNSRRRWNGLSRLARPRLRPAF
jgi:hypothetical protein